MKLYHLSKMNMDGNRITPKVPSNYFTKYGYEDATKPRVCFSTSIDGCLRGLSQNLKDKEYYVHVPNGKYKTYKPSTKEVPDCKVTGELWITRPVDLKCIGKIKVIKDKGEDGILFNYGSHTGELYDWEWKWIERYDNNDENVIKESTNYEWKSPEELSKWMKSNIKYDHSSNWRLRSPEETINSKKGDCHDQSLLEYEVLKSLGYKAGRLFMVEYSSWNQPGGATHTACWYEKSNKYYWFENAWGGKEGIHGPYKSLDELKSAIADEWNWSGKNDKLYMGNCTGVKVGMNLGEYVSAVTPEKESSKVFHKNDYNISSQESCSFLNVQSCMLENDTNVVNESYIFSKDDLYINYEDFESGKSNICLVTGLSGSGKSTLAKQIASKYSAELIELDIFDSWWHDQLTGYELDRVNDIFKKWFSTHESGAHNKPRNELKFKDLDKDCNKFIHYCIPACAKDKSKKYIIEGVQIYEYMKYKEIKSYPLVIKNASVLKSIIQRWKRNGDGKVNLLAELINTDLPDFVKWYAGEDKSLNNLRKAVIKEDAISEEKRSEIPTNEFGVPSKRKFPLTDAKHVKSAIKFFNYVDEEDEAELARNIKRKAKEFGVVIRCGKQNRLSKYINKEYVNEFMAAGSIGNCMYAVSNGNIKQHIAQGDHIVSATDSYPYTKKEKRKKKDPVDGRISVYMGDGEKLTVNESVEKVPIYIIAYDYSSVFAVALKATTHSHYNHIAIALSPDLEHAYTFARSIKGDHSAKGFAEEPLSSMIKEHGNFYIKVNAVYIPKSAYDKIKSMINDYKKHRDDTRYNYGNLVRGALGIKVDNDDLDSDNMNCSIFVDYMLKNAGVDITDNPNSNLVFPEHLANADMDHDNVVTVYYGNAKGYNKKKVSKMKFLGESIDDDTFFDNLEKQFEDLDMEPIPTDIFNERKDQG